MRYELVRLSSGWLVTIPGEKDTIESKFVTEIKDAFPFIAKHAKKNLPPFHIKNTAREASIK